MPCVHSDREECDHAFTPETDSDGDKVTASDVSDADSERDGRSEDKTGTNSKAVDNKCCLCQTDFSCNNGKRSVLSNFLCHSF